MEIRRVSELVDRSTEIIQYVEQREKGLKTNGQSLRNWCENIKRFNM